MHAKHRPPADFRLAGLRRLARASHPCDAFRGGSFRGGPARPAKASWDTLASSLAARMTRSRDGVQTRWSGGTTHMGGQPHRQRENVRQTIVCVRLRSRLSLTLFSSTLCCDGLRPGRHDSSSLGAASVVPRRQQSGGRASCPPAVLCSGEPSMLVSAGGSSGGRGLVSASGIDSPPSPSPPPAVRHSPRPRLPPPLSAESRASTPLKGRIVRLEEAAASGRQKASCRL